jgi:hypothetical protein
MIIQRGKSFYLRRRVPDRYRGVENRGTIWVSLHTDSPTVAGRKASGVWAELEEVWEARLAGETEDAEARYAAAIELARVRGHRYADARQVANLPTTKLTVPDRGGEPQHGRRAIGGDFAQRGVGGLVPSPLPQKQLGPASVDVGSPRLQIALVAITQPGIEKPMGVPVFQPIYLDVGAVDRHSS